jgi:hypothetical protein
VYVIAVPCDGCCCRLLQIFSCGIWAVRSSLNGTGKQPISAKIALISAYCVGIPSAALCCFGFGWGVHGLWVGLTLGNITAVALLLYKVVTIDWAKETKLARDRALAKKKSPPPAAAAGGSGGGGGKSDDDSDMTDGEDGGGGVEDEEGDARRGLLDDGDPEDSEEQSWVRLDLAGLAVGLALR